VYHSRTSCKKTLFAAVVVRRAGQKQGSYRKIESIDGNDVTTVFGYSKSAFTEDPRQTCLSVI